MFAAQIGLRALGAGILSGAWLVGAKLYAIVHAHPPSQASMGEWALCAVLVVLLVAGNALLFVGPGLWRQVPIPGRWSAALIEPRQFDVLLDGRTVRASKHAGTKGADS
ncbi:hypothetical protein [Novosphingobium resinovorum]|uniref:hypothetical protein n=1 Tax=Novosphingobium resinovorum TaxID=158500 RepID=UPI002ED5E2FB|nr:hypothetical protein [Novosphingobium resinovorum]